MFSFRDHANRILRIFVFVLATVGLTHAQGVKRVVIVKIDGLPGYYVDKFVHQRDPNTGKSLLNGQNYEILLNQELNLSRSAYFRRLREACEHLAAWLAER